MATLTTFTRPTDPINAEGLATKISSDIGKTVTVVITNTDILVTGVAISESDRNAIQTSITSYFYPNTQIGVQIVDNPDMSTDRHNMSVTEHAAYVADTAIKTYADSKFTKVYKGGTLKTSPKFYYNSAVISSGSVTFYLTDNGAANGNAIFTSVDKESFSWWIDDANNQYQLGGYILSGDKKSITLNVNRLGTVLIGIIQFITGANGVTVNLAVWGE